MRFVRPAGTSVGWRGYFGRLQCCSPTMEKGCACDDAFHQTTTPFTTPRLVR